MKRQNKTRIVIMLLTCLLLVTVSGCSGMKTEARNQKSEEIKTPMGRYVETRIPMPEKVESGEEVAVSMLENPEHKIEIMAVPRTFVQQTTKYCLEDQAWEREELDALEENELYSAIFAYGPDGALYAVQYALVDGRSEISDVRLVKLEKDYKPTEVEGILEKKQKDVISLQILGNNEAVVSTYLNAYYWKDGKATTLFLGANPSYAQKDMLMGFPQQEDKAVIYDLKTGSIIKEIEVEGGTGPITGDGENWYLVNPLGIHRLALNGTTWETLVDGGMNSMSKPSCSPETIIKQDDIFYVMYQGENGKREVAKYHYDSNVPTKPEKTLSVVTLEENEILQQAAVDFQKKNPNIQVEIQNMETGEGAATVTDQIKAINTELLAGKGPDIILLDQMPIDSYIEKGVLEDLSPYLEQLEAEGQLNQNIVESYRTKGKLYTIPLRVGIPIYYGEDKAVKAALDMETLAAEAKKQKTALLGDGYSSRETLLKKLYGLHQDELFDENGAIKTEEFLNFLNQLKDITDSCNAVEYQEDSYIDTEDTYGMTSSLLYAEGLTKLAYGEINNMTDTIFPWKILEVYGGAYSFINGKYIPYGLVGLNQASTEKEIAGQFITYLFSEEIQEVNVNKGFSVNPKVIDGLVDYENDYLISVPVNGKEVEAQLMEKEEIKKFIGHFKELKSPINQDRIFEEMLIETTKEFLSGNKTAEDTLQILEDKTKAYLSE